MRRTCDLCGKKTQIGRNRSHAQNRTSRTFKANIQKVSLDAGSGMISGHFCSGCLKRIKLELSKTKEAAENKTK